MRRHSATIFLVALICLGICVMLEWHMRHTAPIDATLRRFQQDGGVVLPQPRPRLPVDCVKLFAGDETEQKTAYSYQDSNPKKPKTSNDYIEMTADCGKFISDRGYYTSVPTEAEMDFPLAFSILTFKDVEQTERLLRTVYRPHNIYCIHVDRNSETSLHQSVQAIANCFQNVFVLENSVAVTWGTYSILEADINCMAALLKYKHWKYFINLTGQEFPLKTNWELIRIINSLNGSNLIGGTGEAWKLNPERLQGRPPPPIDVVPIKGPVHITARREFVDYALNDVNAQRLLNWSKLVGHASEIFFSTLNHNPHLGIPGSYLGRPLRDNIVYPFINRYKVFDDHNQPCYGKYARSICILGVGDLPELGRSRHLFANKFHQAYHPLAYDCLEELIYNRTLNEFSGILEFDTTFYSQLQVAMNHI